MEGGEGRWYLSGGNPDSPGSRIYCVTDIDPDHRKLSQLEAMVLFLTGKDPELECECSLPTCVHPHAWNLGLWVR